MDAIYERDTLAPAIPGEQIRLDASSMRILRPSYHLAAYIFGERGYSVNQELPGDDQPESVASLYREGFQWAGVGGAMGLLASEA